MGTKPKKGTVLQTIKECPKAKGTVLVPAIFQSAGQNVTTMKRPHIVHSWLADFVILRIGFLKCPHSRSHVTMITLYWDCIGFVLSAEIRKLTLGNMTLLYECKYCVH